jgi:hypothetical protein
MTEQWRHDHDHQHRCPSSQPAKVTATAKRFYTRAHNTRDETKRSLMGLNQGIGH